MTTDKLIIAYKVITKLMEEHNFTKDTSFVRVKNIISTLICDKLTEYADKVEDDNADAISVTIEETSK